jgi:hypothetical protein
VKRPTAFDQVVRCQDEDGKIKGFEGRQEIFKRSPIQAERTLMPDCDLSDVPELLPDLLSDFKPFA